MLRLIREGVGLAAPQIGISERFFVLALPREPVRVFVNPQVDATAKRSIRSQESCLSLSGVAVEIDRAAWVQAAAWDEHGARFELRARGLLARAVQTRSTS